MPPLQYAGQVFHGQILSDWLQIRKSHQSNALYASDLLTQAKPLGYRGSFWNLVCSTSNSVCCQTSSSMAGSPDPFASNSNWGLRKADWVNNASSARIAGVNLKGNMPLQGIHNTPTSPWREPIPCLWLQVNARIQRTAEFFSASTSSSALWLHFLKNSALFLATTCKPSSVASLIAAASSAGKANCKPNGCCTSHAFWANASGSHCTKEFYSIKLLLNKHVQRKLQPSHQKLTTNTLLQVPILMELLCDYFHPQFNSWSNLQALASMVVEGQTCAPSRNNAKILAEKGVIFIVP